MSVGEIKVRIEIPWLHELSDLISEIKRCPTTEKVAEFTALIEAHTGRKLSAEELFAERETAVAKLRQAGVLHR